VELRLGFIESAAMNWESALKHLARVPTLSSDPFLTYLSHYFSGLALESVDSSAAAGAFERALDVVPRARSASVHLAAQLMLAGSAADRGRAYALLQAAFADGVPTDPWRLYFFSEARLWPVHMSQLRQGFR
jgi:hypothetical protein